MRGWLLILTAVLSGCATTAVVVPSRGDTESAAPLSAAARPARTSGGGTSGGRTETIGLPLTRGQKLGLWIGVAVFLAYLMNSENEEGAGAASR